MLSTAAVTLRQLSPQAENRVKPPFQKIIVKINYSVEKTTFLLFHLLSPSSNVFVTCCPEATRDEEMTLVHS